MPANNNDAAEAANTNETGPNQDALDSSNPAIEEVEPLEEALSTLSSIANNIFEQLPMIALAIVVFVLFYFLAKVLGSFIRKITKKRRSKDLGRIVGMLTKIIVIVIGVMAAMTIAAPSVDPVDLLSTLGIGGVAIGFAFKDILQNLLAGVLILVREPFQIGDQIKFKDFEGTVEKIETRATILNTYDGRRAVIPNGEMYTTAVLVNTAHEYRRSQYDVGIGYGDNIDEAKEKMMAAMSDVEGVIDDPAPEVLTIALNDSYVALRARWWSSPERGEVIHVHERVLTAIKQALDKAGIDMPYPTVVNLFHDQTEEFDGDRTKQREGWTPRPKSSVKYDAPKSAKLHDAVKARNDNDNDNGSKK